MPKMSSRNRIRRSELPDTLKRSGPKAQRTFAKAHDAAAEQYGEGERAHRTAMAALKHTHEKRGDRWVPKPEAGPSDPRSKTTGRYLKRSSNKASNRRSQILRNSGRARVRASCENPHWYVRNATPYRWQFLTKGACTGPRRQKLTQGDDGFGNALRHRAHGNEKRHLAVPRVRSPETPPQVRPQTSAVGSPVHNRDRSDGSRRAPA